MSAEQPLVVLTVGTDSHPFDRAVRWVDGWAARNPGVEVVAQWGTSAPPTHAGGAPLLPRPELDTLLRTAGAVVCHGGPATLHQVRQAGLLPLCLPRDPAHGEHVDDHQLRFARHQADHGRVQLVTDEADLHRLLDRVLDDPAVHAHEATHDALATGRAVTRFGHFVAALLDDDEAYATRLHREALREAGR